MTTIGTVSAVDLERLPLAARTAYLLQCLDESETRFGLIFEGAPYGMALARSDGYRFIMVNQAFCDFVGYSRTELLEELTCQAVTFPEDLEREAPYAKAVVRGECDSYRMEKRYVRKDGSIVWGGLTMLATRNPDGSLRHAFGIVEDITERKRVEQQVRDWNQLLEQRVLERTRSLALTNAALQVEIAERKRIEQQLLQAQKLESIGRLAGGIAHDFNNLLTAIIGTAELALADADAEQPVVADLREIKAVALRAADLTRQLLTFARQQNMAAQPVNINDLLRPMYTLLRRLIGEDIALVWQLGEPVGAVYADPHQLEQVVVNLAVNARDAMPRGGQMTITTSEVSFAADDLTLPTGLDPGSYICVAVADTGTGMSDAVRQHVFEPFFTTKEVGKGTGLGLAVCHGIINQHHGSITLESAPGKGTTVRLYLPRTEGEAAAALSTLDQGGEYRGSERILLVEDDGYVRELTARMLRSHGYSVVAASDGEEALRCYATIDGCIDLLLTDIVMPGMSGVALAEELTRQRPELKVIFISGYAEADLLHRAIHHPHSAVQTKPYTPTALAARVRLVLDGG